MYHVLLNDGVLVIYCAFVRVNSCGVPRDIAVLVTAQ